MLEIYERLRAYSLKNSGHILVKWLGLQQVQRILDVMYFLYQKNIAITN